MSVQILPVINFTAIEILDTGVDGVTQPNVSHDNFNTNGPVLNGSSSVPVTKVVYRTYTLVAGALTIDLTALQGVNDEVIDASGLKLQTLVIIIPTDNNVMTIKPAVANGYDLFGANGEVTLGPSEQAFNFKDQLPDVAAGAKDIDITGTGTEQIKIGMCLG